jgi:CDP-diacylglycerol---glycerol-3-phosphate 3-phosphatidyltransferase
MKKFQINGPTYLTILRIILSLVFLIFILIPETWAQIVALIIFIIAAITDKIDGIWARQSHIVTDLGAFLDPLADKMLVNLAFLALVYLGMVPVWAFAIILVRDFAVDGLRMMFAKKGIPVAASFFGKLKTTFQMLALAVLIFNLIVNLTPITIISNILLYLALIFTVLSGANYFKKAYQKILK